MNDIETLLQLSPPALLALALTVLGRLLKSSPMPDWAIPFALPIAGACIYPWLPSTAVPAVAHQTVYNALVGFVAGAGAVGINQAWRQAGKRLIDGPEQPGGNGSTTNLLLALFACGCLVALSGCARFSTTQTDYSYENGQEVRKVTTKAKANTFFAGKSALAKFKASQTDKTQSASVGSLDQSVEGTNTVAIIESIATGIAKGIVAGMSSSK